MRVFILILAILTLLAQYHLWWGQDGISSYFSSRAQLVAQNTKITTLTEKNNVLKAQLDDLKTGEEAVEELARIRLGMIREGERFVQILEAKDLPDFPHDKSDMLLSPQLEE